MHYRWYNSYYYVLIFFAECTNNFVQVEYKENTSDSTISCVFPNQSDISEKVCCITHQLCDQKERISQECNKHLQYKIDLEASESVSSGQLYCYTAIASNNTYTVKVEGSFITGIANLTLNYFYAYLVWVIIRINFSDQVLTIGEMIIQVLHQ